MQTYIYPIRIRTHTSQWCEVSWQAKITTIHHRGTLVDISKCYIYT